jgi:hypothetical protein
MSSLPMQPATGLIRPLSNISLICSGCHPSADHLADQHLQSPSRRPSPSRVSLTRHRERIFHLKRPASFSTLSGQQSSNLIIAHAIRNRLATEEYLAPSFRLSILLRLASRLAGRFVTTAAVVALSFFFFTRREMLYQSNMFDNHHRILLPFSHNSPVTSASWIILGSTHASIKCVRYSFPSMLSVPHCISDSITFCLFSI